MQDILNQAVKQFGVDITDEMYVKFEFYRNALKERNKIVNLTAIKDDYDIVIKHFADSLSIIPIIREYREGNRDSSGRDSVKEGRNGRDSGNEYSSRGGSSSGDSSYKHNSRDDSNEDNISKNNVSGDNINIIDVGTGAGFPGIPLKIVLPDICITLMDSVNKKVEFVSEIIDMLSLKNAEAMHGRAEDLAHMPEYREQYDISVARAVASLPVLCEYCIPFLKVGGIFISMKAGEAENLSLAKNALAELGSEIIHEKSFSLGKENYRRKVIVIKKFRHNSTKYPRKSGKPTKNPL